MRFECDFANPRTGERRTIAVTLSGPEIAHARGADDAELTAQAFALHRAYSQVPQTFLHDPAGIRHLSTH